MEGQYLSYKERLAITWYLTWRGFVYSAATGAIVGFVWSLLFSQFLPLYMFGLIYLLNLLVVFPFLLAQLIRKRFKSFTLKVQMHPPLLKDDLAEVDTVQGPN
jgi:hypothetical protein